MVSVYCLSLLIVHSNLNGAFVLDCSHGGHFMFEMNCLGMREEISEKYAAQFKMDQKNVAVC